jgi:hypothetical protein
MLLDGPRKFLFSSAVNFLYHSILVLKGRMRVAGKMLKPGDSENRGQPLN